MYGDQRPWPLVSAASTLGAMAIGNRFVSALVRSPLHRVMSGSVNLVRYQGRRSGRQITTPTQYATHGDDIVILVARHETKTWWRNFVAARDIDVLISGVWRPMTARAVIGADEPELAVALMESYLRRFPSARRIFGDLDREAAAQRAVFVQCRPR